MPLIRAGRLLKRWRYAGVYCSELSLCAGAVRIGPLRQSFWAVWDRRGGRLRECTKLSQGGVHIAPGRLSVRDRDVEIELQLAEGAGIEVVTPYDEGYVWTRKQAGVPASGAVVLSGNRHLVEGDWAFIDDWAGYPPRRTWWQWSAGVGTDIADRRIAWNLVSGINDGDHDSERAVWIDGRPREVGPVTFSADLSEVRFADGAALIFTQEAVRRRRENLWVIRSDYEQPFGTFRGELPGGVRLRDAYGVMERHDATW